MVRILITDNFELVAQGHTAKTKLNRRHVAPGPAASLGHIGGRRPGGARKNPPRFPFHARPRAGEEKPPCIRHGFPHPLSPSPGGPRPPCTKCPARKKS